MIRYSLSSEELIRNRMQLIKVIQIMEDNNKVELNKIKPNFIKEMESINKPGKEYEQDSDSYI